MTFTLISCESLKKIEENKIYLISYSTQSGDKGGNHRNLEIKQDSILYEYGNRIHGSKNLKIKTPKETWEMLTSINLKEFDKIDSNESRQVSDGTDETISITTKSKVYSFTNGDVANSTEMKNFISDLKNIMSSIKDPKE
jgi:hypothetical protein